MNKSEFNTHLMTFLDNSMTPYHATKMMKAQLLLAGFEELNECDHWQLAPNGAYFVMRNDASIIAFHFKSSEGMTLIGAHTDSPNLKLKPNPSVKSAGCSTLGVEPYGGVLLNPWFDRDLGLAGKVSYLNSSGEVCDAIIDFSKSVGIISSLAIHLDADANSARSINKQTDILPLVSMDEAFDVFEAIAAQIDDEVDEILSHDLRFYERQGAAYVGLQDEFIASARLDNLLSCYVALHSLIENSDANALIVCNDHEEVGSESSAGAAGNFLEQTLKRICNNDHETFVQCCRSALLISTDNAHAHHPNYSAKHDTNHAPHMNSGVVIKHNANQRYATNVSSVAPFKVAAKEADLPIQEYVTRSDMRCGSTIGPITATRLGIETIDIGLPTLAMHSTRELCGSDDAFHLTEILSSLLKIRS